MLNLHLLAIQRPTGETQLEALEGLLKVALRDRSLLQHLHHTGAERLTLAGGQVAARATWRLLPCDGSQQGKDENNDECSGSPPDSIGT